jgi:hypothetical protein
MKLASRGVRLLGCGVSHRIVLVNAALLVSAGCGRPTLAPVAPADCAYAVPRDATPFGEIAYPQGLAGDYELIQVAWQPAPPTITRGVLHLEVPDSAWREVPCNLGKMRRNLIGWYRPDADVPSAWRAVVESKDPKQPGVVAEGSGFRVGMHCVMDGSGENFEITAVSPRGLWGYWSEDLGIAVLVDSATRRPIPNRTGFFCALRKGGM